METNKAQIQSPSNYGELQFQWRSSSTISISFEPQAIQNLTIVYTSKNNNSFCFEIFKRITHWDSLGETTEIYASQGNQKYIIFNLWNNVYNSIIHRLLTQNFNFFLDYFFVGLIFEN